MSKCPVKGSPAPVPNSIEEDANYRQTQQPDQTFPLHTTRVKSSIPRSDYMPSHQACPVINNDKSSPASSSSATADPSDNWIYPSEQQYFNAVTRKGWKNVKAEDVPMIVKIHNEVNERSWNKVLMWESIRESTRIVTTPSPPTLVRFIGRPKDRSPKSYFMTGLGYELFDRHDWIVQRTRLPFFWEKPFLPADSLVKEEQRYVVDFYDSGSGNQGNQGSENNSIHVDVRPAFEGGGIGDRVWSWVTGQP
ncbi:hypothetical protein TrCOL_g1172 [Triparma columacea]|uniref:Holocytochrome c-type synthase n=1 Tax=Triparma columacea TaxID=722753 RepID=A0A9W7GN39_9STRA|nr:hypothetical protein TrCOL_g1172 [Triparma columacea]